MAVMEAVASKFRGCMVGALMGDCFGAPFEGDINVPRSVLNSYFKRLLDPDLKVPYKAYTDDTAMARSVAQSLIDSKGYNAKDMARKFVKEFYAEPNRGYGANIVDVFAALRVNKFNDVYTPAGLQFGGRGSFGNGECLAVHLALHTPYDKLDAVNFVETLIAKMKKVETPTEDDIFDEGEEPFLYVKKLTKVLELMERGSCVTKEQVGGELGNHIAAHLSVPTAIYSFIRATNSISGVETENPIQRTLHYAIGLGGDTDTIATMAGSIAGAYYGMEKVPENLKRHCEALADAIKQADELFSLVEPVESSS